MRVLNQNELHAVSGGGKGGQIAMGLAIGWGSAVAGAGVGFVVGSAAPGIGNVAGAAVGFLIGAGAGIGYILAQ